MMFRKPLTPNRGTLGRKYYYLSEMSHKAQVHVCVGRGAGWDLTGDSDITPYMAKHNILLDLVNRTRSRST